MLDSSCFPSSVCCALWYFWLTGSAAKQSLRYPRNSGDARFSRHGIVFTSSPRTSTNLLDSDACAPDLVYRRIDEARGRTNRCAHWILADAAAVVEDIAFHHLFELNHALRNSKRTRHHAVGIGDAASAPTSLIGGWVYTSFLL